MALVDFGHRANRYGDKRLAKSYLKAAKACEKVGVGGINGEEN
jgi:hypothetical protein